MQIITLTTKFSVAAKDWSLCVSRDSYQQNLGQNRFFTVARISWKSNGRPFRLFLFFVFVTILGEKSLLKSSFHVHCDHCTNSTSIPRLVRSIEMRVYIFLILFCFWKPAQYTFESLHIAVKISLLQSFCTFHHSALLFSMSPYGITVNWNSFFSCDEQLKKWRCHFVCSSVRPSVRPKPYFSFLQNEAMEL